MQLKSFRITNFRSIKDSGEVTTNNLTALVGRNESGKSNLLLALRTLNDDDISQLVPIKDFPRDRKLQECQDDTPILESTWELNANERQILAEKFPRADGVSNVKIYKDYSEEYDIVFDELPSHGFDKNTHNKQLKKALARFEVNCEEMKISEEESTASITTFSELSIDDNETPGDWSQRTNGKPNELRKFIVSKNIESDELDDFLDSLEKDISRLDDTEQEQEAKAWIEMSLPKFIYVDDYPDISGHLNLIEYQNRKNQGSLNQEDIGFEKLCKVAGIDPIELIGLSDNADMRNQLVNRASAVVTQEIKRLWKDRALKVRFNLDGNYLNTYISDPNATYDVEVNLNERSRGFKWFFSFYIAFCADTNDGDASNAILLLDEPGLFLHARSQEDLLVHLKDDFENQIIYTTHSPFLIPTSQLMDVKTVSIDQERGTTVNNEPQGDSTTIFPLQAALGYEVSQSLFIGSHNLIVEGVTDYWYLSAVSDYLISIGRKGLNTNITITPAGGAQKIPYMVSLLASQHLSVVVLMDKERESEKTQEELVASKLLHKNNLIMVSDPLEADRSEADIEDLFDDEVYQALVQESYSTQVGEKQLAYNKKIPRISKQAEAALRDVDKKISFIKAKPARLFLNKLKSNPEQVLGSSVIDTFERLFEIINTKIKNASKNKP